MVDVELNGKVALVTGASSGIGLEACVKLARMGAEVVLVARDAKRTDDAVAEVKRRSGSAKVSRLLCDFSSQAQTRRLADEFRATHDRLDILVNNAGLVSDKRRTSEEGIELTFAVNHLGYFLLTNLLLDLVEKSAPARIVNVASRGHYQGKLDFDDLGYEKGGYFIMAAYARSKLANVLFTRELARRLEGKGVTVNCLHPGVVATNIWDKAPWFVQPILAIYKRVAMISPEQGGDTIVQLAASPEVEGKTGLYFSNMKPRTPSAIARDDATARRLWDESARLVKL